MNIEQIPSDELVLMTEVWHRSFNALGCDPACHCCDRPIPVGDMFKLATVEEGSPQHTSHPAHLQEAIDKYDETSTSREVMLCEVCTPKKYKNSQIRKLKERKEAFKDQPGKWGCFRINGKIVH